MELHHRLSRRWIELLAKESLCLNLREIVHRRIQTFDLFFVPDRMVDDQTTADLKLLPKAKAWLGNRGL